MTNVCKLTRECDEAGCDERVTPGVGTRCGGDNPELGCHKYFCDSHLYFHAPALLLRKEETSPQDSQFLCIKCYTKFHP